MHLLIFSQYSSPFPEYPGLQVHTMILAGSSSLTEHSALAAHGLMAKQGFRHSPEKQASLLAQSASDLQPSSIAGSDTTQLEELIFYNTKING